jgi:hypothetical protein
MFNQDFLLFFVFIFTILVSLKSVVKFLGFLVRKEPQPIIFTNRELIFLGLSISYLITYIYFK